MKKIYLIHENKDWLQPLEKVLLDKGIPFTEWNMVDRTINLFTSPPEGIFFNRMSASSHSRGNRYCPELTTGLISWLEVNKRLVLNGSNAQRLELSKMIQYSELNLVGLKVPKTICSTTLKGIIDAAKILNSYGVNNVKADIFFKTFLAVFLINTMFFKPFLLTQL